MRTIVLSDDAGSGALDPLWFPGGHQLQNIKGTLTRVSCVLDSLRWWTLCTTAWLATRRRNLNFLPSDVQFIKQMFICKSIVFWCSWCFWTSCICASAHQEYASVGAKPPREDYEPPENKKEPPEITVPPEAPKLAS